MAEKNLYNNVISQSQFVFQKHKFAAEQVLVEVTPI